MNTRRDYGGIFMDNTELEKIVRVLEQKADELRGHFLVFEDFECARCGGGDERLGLDLCVPPEKGTRFLNRAGRPLVMINVRLCEDCIRWVTAVSEHESQFVDKILGGLQWKPEGESGEEDKCGLVTPLFQSLLSG
jgi:hypothetical protein